MLTIVALALGIIGGSPSDDEAVVCLSADALPLCSGVMIGRRTVLTAGHCIEALGPGVPYYVNFGPDCLKPRARLRVEEQRTHPEFTGEGKPFDLGMMKLVAEVELVPFQLSDAPVEALTGRTLRHVGFGTSQEQPMGGRGARLTVSHAALRVDADFIWSGDDMANTCLGDSGGPALLDEQIVAVVSDGPDCHSPSADQRVDRGREWIDAARATFEPALPRPKPGCSTAPGLALLALLVALKARRVS